MRFAVGVLLGCLSFMMPGIGYAQRPSPSVLWQRPVLLATPSAPTGAATRSLAQAPDHRWEGMAIGAGAGAVAFGLLGAVVCSQSDTNNCTGIVVGTALLGAFCGGIAGGLIGGSIPKDEPAGETKASS